MKNFKDLLSEVAQPKSAEEQRFKDLHKVELIKHPVAPDYVHTGEVEGLTKKARPADQSGDDNYDQAYAVKDKPFKMPRNIDEELDEAKYTSKQYKMAFGVLNDPRWKGGNMTQIVSTIEKIAKGLSKDKAVAHAIRVTNEELNEAKVGDECSCCGGRIDEDGKCGCGPECKHCGGQHDISESTGISFKNLLEKVVEDVEDFDDLISEEPEYVSEEPQQEIPMMMRQLHFIGYAADEIMEYLAMGEDPEEWYQNKLANAFSMMKTLHAYVEGDKRMGKDDLEASYMMSSYYGEETELEEANFKAGNMKLKDGSQVKISMNDARAITAVMKTLNPKNRKEMESRMMKDKKGFEEILDFAREAQ